MTRSLALRGLVAAVLTVSTIAALAACTPNTQEDPMTDTTATTIGYAAVNGTNLYFERRGTGVPLLLIHGAGEDAAMLAAQADAFATEGFEVLTYDRRGTGRSGREDWPGGGAGMHADDAAALLRELDLDPAVVLGFSSGGVVALALAADHPDTVARVLAWEAPAAGAIPGGAELTAQLMAPVEEHLAANPGDYVGAQAILLEIVLGVPVAVDDPAFAATREHAESMVRDDPAITLEAFERSDFDGRDVTIVIGDAPNEVVAAAAVALADLTGRAPVEVIGGHEVYLLDPGVLVALLVQDRVGTTA